jgi:hypothetical protein
MKTVARNVVVALALLVSAAAFAQDTDGSTVMPRNWDAQVYGDVGLHITGISTDSAAPAAPTSASPLVARPPTA